MSDANLAGVIDTLTHLDADVDDATRIDRIRDLEELKAAAAAAQARETASFAASQRAAQAEAGLGAGEIGRGIASQVALARRISPAAAARYVGWATILTTELPATFRELSVGRTSEWRAMVIAKESVFLSREHRAELDSELAPQLAVLGDKRTEAEARRIGYRLDPDGFVARARNAVADRHVSLRPAPDAMARLSALLPVAEAVACYANLGSAADSTTAAGDERGRGQIMADTLVERLTGQTHAENVPLALNLVMAADTLLNTDGADSDAPVHAEGYGPIPSDLARDLIHQASADTPMWLRRLFVSPRTGELVAMDSKQRCFTPAQRRFIRLRDQWCRTPYCEAPIRQFDHVNAHRHGGPTSVDQGQGLCEACNYAKEAPGWNATVLEHDKAPNEVEITTPTGHRYRSAPPDPPGRRKPAAASTCSSSAAARHTSPRGQRGPGHGPSGSTTPRSSLRLRA